MVPHVFVRTFSAVSAALTLIATVCATIFATAAPAAAQGRIVDRHGDWQIRCEQPVGSPAEQCALVQNVEAQDRANVGLTVIFLRTADRQARILRVLAPLGVLLPSGLGLSIDDNEVGLAGFVRCLPEGCIAEVELDDGLLERFGAGKTATFVIFQTPEEGIGIPISLNGFTGGFAALDNPPPPAPASEIPPAAPPQPVETTVETTQVDPADAPRALVDTADERTELDRLLEDPMLPYVAAGAFMILAIAIVLIIIAARGRGRRRRMRDAQEEIVDHEESFETADDEDDGLAALEGGAAPAPGASRERLAPGRRQRQLPSSGAEPRPEGNAPRAPGAPRGPNAPRGPRQR